MANIFHLTLPQHWEAAQRAGEITMSTRDVTLAEEGFVHCSFADQVAATAANFFGDVDEVVLLRIDTELLTSDVLAEDLYGSGEDFPHVYGPIDVGAVVEARVVSPLDVGLV